MNILIFPLNFGGYAQAVLRYKIILKFVYIDIHNFKLQS